MAEAPNSFSDPYWTNLAANAESRAGVPAGVVQSLVTHGERSNNGQVSSAGARTPFQIIPSTRDLFLKKYGVDAYLSPENAATVAALHIKESLDRGASVPRAVAEYNGGTDPAKWDKTVPSYVQRVLGGIGAVRGGEAAGGRSGVPQSTFQRVLQEQQQRPQANAQLSKIYDAYKSGAMGAEDAAQFEADVNAGTVMLPRGASLNTQAPKASGELPAGVLQAYKDSQKAIAEGKPPTMLREDMIDLEKDVAGGMWTLPKGEKLGKTDSRGIVGAVTEAITGNERSTPTTQELPEWTTMPELNAPSFKSFLTGLGTMAAGPAEIAQIIKAQSPNTKVRQDEKGNYILRSGTNNQEYAIPPGLKWSDLPRILGGVAAFVPAGRATTITGSALANAGTAAAIEGTQAAAGGEFNPADVAIASGIGAAVPAVARAVSAIRQPAQAAIEQAAPVTAVVDNPAAAVMRSNRAPVEQVPARRAGDALPVLPPAENPAVFRSNRQPMTFENEAAAVSNRSETALTRATDAAVGDVPVSTAAPATATRRATPEWVEPESTSDAPKSLLSTIREMGGINSEQGTIRDVTGEGRAGRGVGGIPPGLFHKNGKGLDDLATQLRDRGYLIPEDAADGGVQRLKDMIRDEINGAERHYSAFDEEAIFAKAAQRARDRHGPDDVAAAGLESLSKSEQDKAFAISENLMRKPPANWANKTEAQKNAELDNIFGADTNPAARSPSGAGTVPKGNGSQGQRAAEAAAEVKKKGAAKPAAAGESVTAEELGKLIQTASGEGMNAVKAQEEIARHARLNKDALATAERLGIEVPADVFSDSQLVREAAGLTRSVAGSTASARWRDAIEGAAKRGNELMGTIDASPNVAAVSDKVRGSLMATRDDLEKTAKKIYGAVNSAIKESERAQFPWLKQVLETVKKENPNTMSAQENRLDSLISTRGATYGDLRRAKDAVGDAIAGKQNDFSGMTRGPLKRLYAALADDQIANVERIGGTQLANDLREANKLYAQKYALDKRIVNAFGRDNNGSIANVMKQAIEAGSRGDVKALNNLLDIVPKDLQKETVASALMSAARAKGGAVRGDFGFSEFNKLYTGLRQNEPVYARIVAALGGKDAHNLLSDLNTVSKRVTDARANVLTTGKANQGLVNSLKAEGLVSSILGKIPGTMAGVATYAAGGRWAGAMLARNTVNALSAGKQNVMESAGKMFSSPEFQKIMTEAATGTPKPETVKRLAISKRFSEFANKVGLPREMKARERWIMQALESGNARGEE